ncbi:MAG: hypothetical protein QM762_15570 [Chryseolinea sp.]
MIAFFVASTVQCYSQLWYEDFAAGTTSGSATGTIGGTWSVTATPSGGAGSFSANGTRFEIDNTGSEGTWSTNTINIASIGYAVIDVSLTRLGVGLSAADYVRLYYSLDGGPDILFAERLGTFFSGSTVDGVSAIVAANTVKITIKGMDNSWFGGLSFDDVTVTAAPIIYSRKSGNWTDNSATGTWSLVSHTGAACSCVPLNSQVAIIGNSHTVSLSSSQTNIGVPPTTNIAPGAVDVRSTGVLQYAGSATLDIVQGLFRIRSGGIVNSASAAITGEQISFNANVGAANLQIDAGGDASIEDLVIGPNTTNSVYMSGAGALTVSDDILINADNSTLYNNFTGALTVNDRIEFQTGVNNAEFVNNQPLTLNTIYFDDDNDTFTNNATATATSLASGIGDDGCSLTNVSGATLNIGSVATSGSTNILNAGTINQTGNFITVVAGSAFTNQDNSTWNWSLAPNTGYSTNLAAALNCTATGNVFNYNGSGAQEIVNETYYHLTLSNTGNKSHVANLIANGNLLISNSAVLTAASALTVDVAGAVTIQNTAVLGGTGSVNVGGNWSAVDGSSYLQGTRTTTFDGTGQTISNTSGTEVFYNLSLAGSGTKSSSNIFDVDNNLAISGSAQLSLTTDLTVGGNWTVTSSNGDPFVEGTRKVTLDGSGAQVISSSLASGETFYKLEITGAGAKSNNNTINITNDFVLDGTATTQLSGAGNINIGGDWDISNSLASNVFVEGTRTVSFVGSGVQRFSSAAANETFYNMTVNNTSTTIPQVTLEKPILVSNNLTLQNGIVDLNNTTFTLGSNTVASTLARTNGWVYNGTFRRGWLAGTISSSNANAYGLFPVGHAVAGAYRPVQVNSGTTAATRPSVGGYFTAQHVHIDGITDLSTPYTTDGTGINFVRKHNAQFVTSITGVTGGTYSISATMTGLLSTGTVNDIRLGVNTGTATAGKVGNHAATTGSTASPVASRNAITTLTQLNNDFRIISTNSNTTPLPVELVSFNARLNNDVVDLDWSTASELNNNFFTVERAVNLEHFEAITEIDGAGTTTRPNSYTHTDNTPLYGRSYYRLKQTDFDGEYTYSKVVTVEYEGPRFASLHAYPNPADGMAVNIIINGVQKQNSIPIQIIDSRGLVVYEKTFPIEIPGVFQTLITFGNRLKPGIYIIRSGQTLNQTQKLIVN